MDTRRYAEWGGLCGPTVKVEKDYQAFLAQKRKSVKPHGFHIELSDINPNAFDWQKRIIQWAVKRGRAALFENIGLGKSIQQLEWCRIMHEHTQGPVMFICPLGVREQILFEAQKFKIDCPIKSLYDASDMIDGINLINYHKLHKFDTSKFAGVSLDESSSIKSVDGKTRDMLIDAWKDCNFRLAATATPAPNDHMELGNQAEFLGVCDYTEMLNRFFVHDSGETQTWRLKRHAVKEFWRWLASWSVCISKPSDIGGSDEGYILPELHTHHHMVEVERDAPLGQFFHVGAISATNIHEERRITNQARCEKVAELVASNDDYWIIWCDTNYEADLLAKLIPNALEVRGSEKDTVKEQKLAAFSRGKARILLSKPVLCGHGMNWQHCNQMIFAGLSYSWERWHQCIGRCLRFGQKRPVHVHIIMANTESSIHSAIAKKELGFLQMQQGMAEEMREGTLEEFGLDTKKQEWQPTSKIQLPDWI